MSFPSAPQIFIRPNAIDQALEFYWSAPVSDGGSAITDYVISDGTITSNTGVTEYYKITGLTNGSNYTFTIGASNADGVGDLATFRTVQPGNLPPNPPIAVSTTFLSATAATIQWSSPIGNGGAAVKWYSVTANPTNTIYSTIQKGALGTDRQRWISGLNENTSYTFQVNAVNDPGYSPAGVPGPYTNFSPSSIAGLQLWLDMSDPLYYTLSNTTVSTILDKSGNGYNMIDHPALEYLPSLGTPINNLTTAYFSQTQAIRQATVLNGVTNMFWVGRQGGNQTCFLFGDDTYYDWHGNNGAFIWSDYANPGIYNAPYWFYSSNMPTPGTGQFLNRGLPAEGTNFILNVNGITGDTRYQGLCYDRSGSTDRGWVGDLGEVIVFSNALTENEINQIHEYLHVKWNI